MDFGRTIRELRRKRDWSVYDLAGRIGRTAGYISKIEARGEIPSPEMIVMLADALGTRAEGLFEIAKREKTEQAASTIERKYDEALILYRKGKKKRS